MLISQSDDHRPADVGETEAEVAEGKAELDREMGRGAKIGTKKGWDAKIHKATEYCDKMTNKSASIKDVIAQNFHWQPDWLVYMGNMGNYYMTTQKS